MLLVTNVLRRSQWTQSGYYDKYGFPRTAAKAAKRVFGFQTGDRVRLVQPSGKHRGTWEGEVAVRADGRFDIVTHAGKITRPTPGSSASSVSMATPTPGGPHEHDAGYLIHPAAGRPPCWPGSPVWLPGRRCRDTLRFGSGQRGRRNPFLLLGYLRGIGIAEFAVNTTDYDAEALKLTRCPDAADQMLRAHQAAAHDVWFRTQIEQALKEANDPATEWVTQEEVEAQSQGKRAEWRAGAEGRKGPV